MKALLIIFALFTFSFAQAAILSKGNDCGVIDVVDGKISTQGTPSIVLNTLIEDQSWDKDIQIVREDNGQNSRVVWSNSWWQYRAAAIYEGHDGRNTKVKIVTQMVGQASQYTLSLYVTMNGQIYSCSNIVVSK
jgi:hypothetical protein